jgi:hypothetical protein
MVTCSRIYCTDRAGASPSGRRYHGENVRGVGVILAGLGLA